MKTDEEECPRCGDPLDDKGRCRACWGDVFGLCPGCGEILSEDGTCEHGCSITEDDCVIEADRASETTAEDFSSSEKLRLVRLTVQNWPGGTRSHQLGSAIRKALGVKSGDMSLVEGPPPKVFDVLTDINEPEFRKRLEEFYPERVSVSFTEIKSGRG